MTASGTPVDVDLLRSEIRRTYTDVEEIDAAAALGDAAAGRVAA